MTSVIVYPHAATIFAAVCACIFIVVGVLGMFCKMIHFLLPFYTVDDVTTEHKNKSKINELIVISRKLNNNRRIVTKYETAESCNHRVRIVFVHFGFTLLYD